jgi:Zn-dependent peptidase ImmA (M78 family)/transcriptional regulator with XRE-family HTH domain
MELGKRLLEARERTKFSLADVRQRTAIGESSLSDIENGKREPKIKQLVQLADLYGKPLSFFLSEKVEAEDTVLWRTRPTEGAELHECKFLKLCAQYRRLEEWMNDVISPKLPSVERICTYADVEELAEGVRRDLNLGDRPAFSLYRALEEDCGIKVFYEELEPTGTAACVRSSQYGWAILLNAKNAFVRQNYDLAHELFHLIVWNVYRPSGNSTSYRAGTEEAAEGTEEQFADKFASCVLLPRDVVMRAVDRKRNANGNLPISMIPTIAKQFGVSTEALLWRLHGIYNWGAAARKEKTQEYVALAKRLTAVSKDEERKAKPAKYPDRYNTLAVQALKRGELSIGRFVEYTEMNRKEAMSYLEQEEDLLGEVQLTAA